MVLGYYLNSEKDAKRIAAMPEPVLPKGTFAGRNIAFTQLDRLRRQPARVPKNAASAGHFNPLVDDDGIVRRVPMLAEFDGAYYEPLSLAVVRTDRCGLPPRSSPAIAPRPVPAAGYCGLEWLEVGPAEDPGRREGRARSFPTAAARAASPTSRSPTCRRPRAAGAAEGQDRAGRHHRAGPARPARDAGRQRLPRGGDPRQPDRRHARRNIKQKPPYMLGAEVVLLLIGGVALALLIPMLAPLLGHGRALVGMLLIGVFNIGDLDVGGHGAAARRVGADDGALSR